MPIITTQTDTGNAVNVTIGASNTIVFVTTTAAVLSSGNTAVSVGTFGAATIMNNGAIIGYNGITTNGSDTTIINAASGTINGYNGAISGTTNSAYFYLQNLGNIMSDYRAVVVAGSNTVIDNSGDISGFYAITSSGSGAMIANDGRIMGQFYAVYFSGATAAVELFNSGQIIGGTAAVYALQPVAIHNSGAIDGDIFLSAGASSIDGVGGTITGKITGGSGAESFDLRYMTVTGTIAGGLGNDSITGTANGDAIYGDNVSGDSSGGADILAGGYGDDSLFGGYGADTLYGNQGDDILYGNQDNDWMHGGQGNDTLYGGQADDTVNGGLGDDLLYGNLGNDSFVFAANFGHDVVGDFNAVPGNSDVIVFGPGTFNSYAEVSANMVQAGNNVVLTLDAADGIVFANTTVAALTADHFLFG